MASLFRLPPTYLKEFTRPYTVIIICAIINLSISILNYEAGHEMEFKS